MSGLHPQGGALVYISDFIMLPENLFWGEHIVASSSVRPCVRPSVHNFCPGYLSATNDRNSMKRTIFHRVMALCNFSLTVHIVQFLSGLFLSN